MLSTAAGRTKAVTRKHNGGRRKHGTPRRDCFGPKLQILMPGLTHKELFMSGSAGKKPAGQGVPPEREMTYLESDEEIRQAIETRQARRAVKLRPRQAPAAAEQAADLDQDIQPDRPLDRPPLAMLCILDDGKADGEWIRLRGDRYLIGRTEGDIRIPHDNRMSSRHAEISRQQTSGGYRWLLTDQQSTNGTFVRVGSTVLANQAEFVVGRGRYRFEAGMSGQAPTTEAPDLLTGGTVPWVNESRRSVVPNLVEVTPGGTGQRFPLNLAEAWIGRDMRTCQIVRADDRLLNARHARLYRDPKGLWHVENNKTVNGVWLRIEQIALTGTCQFRLGEQRFLFRVL
jgi:pSer/pThr/pTyr-binding forkhead associated (FHA) protein